MNNFSESFQKNIRAIKYPLITDKATRLLEKNQYTFIVDRHAKKYHIKQTIETLFNVKITKINTCNLPKKKKRLGKFSGWKPKHKKAIVTLNKGDLINLFTEN